jgi:hypothetical protein
MRWILLVVALSAVAGCSRPSKQDCEKACRHHMELWTAVDRSEAAPEVRAQAEAKRLEWEKNRDNPEFKELKKCVDNCAERGKQSQVDCILKAEQFADAKACWKQ